ncbi:amidase signature domain-containing protein [Aspergillus cavernicola]|uniref:Amidase signature domain-containing protein n=1 Tax=Aspergillus cavernicola TaxID=176166 RepID=A0ABR4INR0_9EURO
MSVFSLNIKQSNPVTTETLDRVAESLGITIAENEKEDYLRLLAVYHESVETLMGLPDYVPQVDEDRFPRENIHFPDPSENQLNAWAWKCDIQDQKPPAEPGLLSGRTIALKDNIAIKRVPMLMGTNMVTGYTPDTDATVVTRVLEAGAIVKGKAVCENLCHSATSSSAATGSVHNPYARGYSSGGSSSGCGALVANGDVDMAIGADQGGSVRVPAGWCGLYGLKPTFGLMPYTGCGSNEPTNDHLGPMTRTVLDNALLLQATAGTDNIDDRSFAAPHPSQIPKYHSLLTTLPTPKDLTGTRIGILTEGMNMPGIDPRIKTCLTHAITRFTDLGASVTEISIPFHTKGAAIWTPISKSGNFHSRMNRAFGRRGHALTELNTLFHPLTQEKWDNAYVSTKNIYLNGAYAETAFPGILSKATNLSRRLRDEYDAALAECDVLVLPNLPYLANSHVNAATATPLEMIAKQVGLTANTAPFNQSGHPVLAMPVGMLEIEEGPLKGEGVKLPVSMQVVGRWWGEMDVYRVAYAWSLVNDWREM